MKQPFKWLFVSYPEKKYHITINIKENLEFSVLYPVYTQLLDTSYT